MSKQFAELARAARLESRVRLREIADALSVSTAYVSAVERGERPAPPRSRAAKWATLVKGDPDVFAQAAANDRAEMNIDEEQGYRRDVLLSVARALPTLSPETADQIQNLLEPGRKGLHRVKSRRGSRWRTTPTFH